MFHDGSSSSSSEAGAFNAIKAAAESKRSIGVAGVDDPIYQAITAELNDPTPRDVRVAPKRESRYIGKLVEKAVQRKEESARISERRLAEREQQESARFADKDRFVTAAYKRKLQKDKARNEIEKLRERKEEDRRSRGMKGFYGNLFSGGNVAMGGKEEPEESDGKEVGLQMGHENQALVQQSLPDKNDGKTDVKGAKKRRRSRFADAKSLPPTTDSNDMNEAKVKEVKKIQVSKMEVPKQKKEKKKRGLRRNDQKSIEEYRRRYFERRAKRLAQEAKG